VTREPNVRLAERAHGPIPQPASFGWPWGDALAVLDHLAPEARVINLETSITRSAGEAPELHAPEADPPRYPVQAAYTPPGPYAVFCLADLPVTR